MKFLLVGLTLWSCISGFAQSNPKPEKVYSIAMEVREADWYLDQSELWKSEIDKNPKNGEAWLNYYAASRALRNLLNRETELYKTHYNLCTQIVTDAQKAIPGTFESYYLDYSQNEGAGGSPEKLLKAAALRPDDPEILDALLIHYHMVRDQEKFETYGAKMFEQNYMPVGMLSWAYNVLSELDENAVLFTCGDNDTYSTWIVQAAKNYRKDVTVINTFLIQVEEYRSKLLKELGYPAFEHTKATTPEEETANLNSLYEHIFKGKRPVYVAGTAFGFFEEKFSEKLYLTGLAYKYSETGFDNESIIRRNYEKRYLLDYLKEVFSHNIGDLKALEFNAAYLPSMMTLYWQYAESEETAKMAEIEAILMKIAVQNGRENEILELLSENSNRTTPLMSAVLDLKSIEKNMVKVKENIYIDKYEATNADYNAFLQNLKLSGNMAKYNEYRCDSAKWTQGKLANQFNEPMKDMYHWNPAYGNYPVVNVSYEAAKAYCEWLTKQYNLQRKRTYTQVVFRLPTPEEWRLAAGSGNAKATNPFSGPNVRDSRGCYLANIQPEPGKFFEDGGFFTVSVKSYEPNKYGMYNTLGNVAEMTSVKGQALGGSWYNLYEECNFGKTQKYTEANPEIGFRIVMEIIEQ